jgi:zinc/manganese transport system substrate-binding protein
MNLTGILRAAALVLLLAPTAAFAKVRVVASTTDLASIAASVGGDQAEVFAIARPNADVHRVEVLPSYMVRVSRADVYLKVGLGLDAWADGIIDGSRNRRLAIVDCSDGVPVLEKPAGKVTAAMGDVHPGGNPHYWLDPRNGAIVARTVAEALAAAEPAHAGVFRARAAAFAAACDSVWKFGRAEAEALDSRLALTYHRSWSYFAAAFGFEIVDTVEPVPGIPPTARHLAGLLATVKTRRVPVLIQEPYYSAEAGRFLARQSDLRVVTASPSCAGPAAGAHLAHFVELIRALAVAN